MTVDRPVFDNRARRVFAKIIVAFPVPRWPDWPGDKAAAAVRADVIQDGLDAGGAERALVAADARFERSGWQRLVAILTGWSQFQHTVSLLSDNELRRRGDLLTPASG